MFVSVCGSLLSAFTLLRHALREHPASPAVQLHCSLRLQIVVVLLRAASSLFSILALLAAIEVVTTASIMITQE